MAMAILTGVAVLCYLANLLVVSPPRSGVRDDHWNRCGLPALARKNERLEREIGHVVLEAARPGMTAARQGRADRTGNSIRAAASGSAPARMLPSA